MSGTDKRAADAAYVARARTDGLTVAEEPDGVMRDLGGSRYGVFNHALMNEVVRTAWVVSEPGGKEAADRKVTGMVVAAMKAFEPKDEIEGMLAAQAVAMHLASMECFRRTVLPEQPTEVSSKLRREGVNLARGMTDMLDALAKRRGERQRKVMVEHVHVHAGGRAVVGAVTAGGALPTAADAPALAQGGMTTGLDDAALVEIATGGEPRVRMTKGPEDPMAPRPVAACGARTRQGGRCGQPAMANGRCRFHGGLSTGPRTAEGLASLKAARTTHGRRGQEARRFREMIRDLKAGARRLVELA